MNDAVGVYPMEFNHISWRYTSTSFYVCYSNRAAVLVVHLNFCSVSVHISDLKKVIYPSLV